MHIQKMPKNLLFIALAISLSLNGEAQEILNVDKNVFQSEYINPQLIKKISKGHYFFDFGKDAFGTLYLTFKSSQSDKVIIHLGEKLKSPGTIDRNPGGTIRYQKVALKDIQQGKELRLQLSPDKRNTGPKAIALPDSFGVIMPFRYCEIENLKVPIEDVLVRQRIYHYRFNDHASDFVISDSILNQVWDLCKYSINATSLCGIYIDGDRERIPYEADAYINQLSHYAVDNEYGMAKESIKYLFTNPTWPTEWLLNMVLMDYQDFYYTGDTALLEEYYEPLKHKTLYELAEEDGLISSFSEKLTGEYMQKLGFADTSLRLNDIVDWPPAQKDTGWKLASAEGERDGHEMVPVNTVVNCFFYENMRMMAELAAVLQKMEDAEFFDQMALKVLSSINEKLLNKETGVYMDGIGSSHSSLHSNMMPLAFGLVPEQFRQSVVDFVKSRKMACSVYGAQYLLEGLYLAGEEDYALGLMTSTSDRSWWNMIRSGSTVTMEAWDLKYKPNLDWNHAWGAAPANIISRYMWGIRPASPGFTHVEIRPQLSELKSSRIKAPTPEGPVIADYRKLDDEHAIYTIILPETMKGELVLKEDPGLLHLKPGKNSFEIKLNK